MPKPKRGSSPPPPPRSSTRPRQPRRISPPQGICSEPSFAHTEAAKTKDDWNDLKARARERLSRFEATNESERLKDCFEGLLDWLPLGGRDSIQALYRACGKPSTDVSLRYA
ncbi:hypothetical protein ACN38_g12537 [Penicillium nordicum]|uniref:Uncharacterized protein n=1 Tax=Penicillium nordicum TaxID=229535 RepID=A0A0M8NQJ8_9EURO|nr:hypothetical protein ACN38_g12537 [Penicillium nordicum]